MQKLKKTLNKLVKLGASRSVSKVAQAAKKATSVKKKSQPVTAKKASPKKTAHPVKKSAEKVPASAKGPVVKGKAAVPKIEPKIEAKDREFKKKLHPHPPAAGVSPAVRPLGKVADKNADKNVEKGAKKAASAPAPLIRKAASKVSDKTPDKSEKDIDKAADKTTDKIIEKIVDKTADKAVDKVVGKAAEKAIEKTPVVPNGKAATPEGKLKRAPERKAEIVEAAAEPEEEVILTDAEGRRYCRVKDCDQIAIVDTYCRYHYLLFWKNIQVRKKILSEGKLERYIEELTARYPDKYLEMLKRDLRSEKDFLAAIQELEIDDSGVENEYEDEAQSYLEEVRGIGGENSAREEEEF